MEEKHSIHVLSSCERRTITITDCTNDEAMAFAIVLFQKFAREDGDQIVVKSNNFSREISLTKGKVNING